MIKIIRCAKPVELTPDLVKELTKKFKKDKSHVWKKKFITVALLSMSNHKCCYCECKITEESKYLEVEHFNPKDIYPDEVVDWLNLLPSCKRCNLEKGSHDAKKSPIIKPCTDNPQEYFYYKSCRYEPRSNKYEVKARLTRTVLYLNDPKISLKRFEIYSTIQNNLDQLLEDIKKYNKKNLSTSISQNIKRRLFDLMKEGHKESEYSSTASTAILTHLDYDKIKKKYKELNIWDNSFDDSEIKLFSTALI